MGHVANLCISTKKGVPKTAIPTAVLREGHGMDGDAHAGPWHRQISLLDARDIDQMRARGLDLAPGAFGENIVVEDVALAELDIGSRLRVGDCELELTQLGKICHSRCAIYWQTGDCIMPRLGIFARVIRGATITAGDTVEVTRRVARDTSQVDIVGVAAPTTSPR